MDNKLSELSNPEQFDAEVEIHGGEPFAVWAPAVNGSHVKAELYYALLAELEAKDRRLAELELRLAVEIEPPPVIYPGRYDCHAMHSAIRRAGFRVSGDSEHVGDVDMRDERALAAVSDKQRIAELEAKLATPVRLTEERTLWAGEDDYDTGHVKGWNANRIEQAALLKKQGFTVAEDA